MATQTDDRTQTDESWEETIPLLNKNDLLTLLNREVPNALIIDFVESNFSNDREWQVSMWKTIAAETGVVFFPEFQSVLIKCVKEKCQKNYNVEGDKYIDPVSLEELGENVLVTDSGYCFNVGRDSLEGILEYGSQYGSEIKDPTTNLTTEVKRLRRVKNTAQECFLKKGTYDWQQHKFM